MTTNTAELKRDFEKWQQSDDYYNWNTTDQHAELNFAAGYQAGRSAAHGENNKATTANFAAVHFDSNVQKVNIAQEGSAEQVSEEAESVNVQSSPPNHWDEWALHRSRKLIQEMEDVNHPRAQLVARVHCLLIDAMEYAAPAPAQTTVDWLGLALDLEQQAKRVDSQTVERAMLAAANGLRIMSAALSAPERNTAASMKPDADLMEKAAAIVKRLYNDTPDYGMCVQAGEIIQWFMRYAVHAAPERKDMTDEEIWKLAQEKAASANEIGVYMRKDDVIAFALALNKQGEQTAPEGWISVKDRMPDPDTWLVAVETDDGVQVHTLELNDKRQWIHEGEPTFCHSYMFHPTHWMPLPAGPSTAQKDGGIE